MPFTTLVQRIRSFSLSIGQLTFASFLLLLAMIVMTSVASVVSIRHIDTTFAELQRLESLGDVSEEIDRRMNELRLAARDFVTDPGAPSDQVGAAATALSALLKRTRLELAPEQQDMIDGVTQRLANYRDGIERVSGLIATRAQLVAALPPVRERFESVVAEVPDRDTARNLFRTQNQIAEALLAHDPAAAEQSARRMREIALNPPELRAAVDAYADAVISIAGTEGEIATLDKEVLGTEGQQIGRVTELLRDVSASRGRVLANDFARTLAHDKWQSIILGLAGVLIGLVAALFVVRRTVGPLKAIAGAIRSLAGGEKHTSIPATDVNNEIGDIARAAEVFSPPANGGRCRRRAGSGGPRAGGTAACRGRLSQTVRGLRRRDLRDDAGRRASQRQSGIGTDDGVRHASRPHSRCQQRHARDLRSSGGSRGIPFAQSLMQRRRRSHARVPEYPGPPARRAVLWLSDSATAVRDEAGGVIRYEGTVRDITTSRSAGRRRRRRRPADAAAGDRHRARRSSMSRTNSSVMS